MRMAFAESLGLGLFCECQESLTLMAVWDEWDEGKSYWNFDDAFVEVHAGGLISCSECKKEHGRPPSAEEVRQFEADQRMM